MEFFCLRRKPGFLAYSGNGRGETSSLHQWNENLAKRSARLLIK